MSYRDEEYIISLEDENEELVDINAKLRSEVKRLKERIVFLEDLVLHYEED